MLECVAPMVMSSSSISHSVRLTKADPMILVSIARYLCEIEIDSSKEI